MWPPPFSSLDRQTWSQHSDIIDLTRSTYLTYCYTSFIHQLAREHVITILLDNSSFCYRHRHRHRRHLHPTTANKLFSCLLLVHRPRFLVLLLSKSIFPYFFESLYSAHLEGAKTRNSLMKTSRRRGAGILNGIPHKYPASATNLDSQTQTDTGR